MRAVSILRLLRESYQPRVARKHIYNVAKKLRARLSEDADTYLNRDQWFMNSQPPSTTCEMIAYDRARPNAALKVRPYKLL